MCHGACVMMRVSWCVPVACVSCVRHFVMVDAVHLYNVCAIHCVFCDERRAVCVVVFAMVSVCGEGDMKAYGLTWQRRRVKQRAGHCMAAGQGMMVAMMEVICVVCNPFHCMAQRMRSETEVELRLEDAERQQRPF